MLAEQIPLRSRVLDRRIERDDRITEDEEIGPAAGAIDRIRGVALPASKCVPAVAVR